MCTVWYEECKDRIPNETIRYCKNILARIGMDYELYWGKGSIVKSVKIIIKGCNISSDGKGITKEYALASAFGELLERLLNGVFFRMNSDLFQKSKIQNRTFSFLNFGEIERYLYDFFIMFKANKHLNNNNLSNSVLKYLHKLNQDEQIVCVKFENLENSVMHIPCGLIDIIYGTNGMCAGNTREEALVQGISEIFERYTITQILLEKIHIINVTERMKKQYSTIKEYVVALEKKEGVKVSIYQCIQSIKIPAFVLIYLNKNSGTYIVKVGVHLCHRIAIERCFTELLQGKSEDNMFGLSRIHNCNDMSQNNKEQIFRDGRGNYPISIFGIEEYESKSIVKEPINYKNNEDILQYYYKELLINGFEILIADVSIKDFYAYHVIIPEMSETLYFEQFENNLGQYINTIELISYIKKIYIGKLRENEVKKLYDLLSSYKKNLFIPLNLFIKDYCEYERKKLSQVRLIDILFYCNSILNQREELKEIIVLYIQYLNKIEGKNMLKNIDYCSCLLSLIKYDNENIVHFFYSQQLINKVKNDIKTHFTRDCKICFCDECGINNKSNECPKYKAKRWISTIAREMNDTNKTA